MKWYVKFYKDGKSVFHCFEDDEKQARHFASLVCGYVFKDW